MNKNKNKNKKVDNSKVVRNKDYKNIRQITVEKNAELLVFIL